MASNTRPYIIIDAETGEGVAVIDKATTPAHALRIMAGSRWIAQAASAADVLAAVKDRLPIIDADKQAADEAKRQQHAEEPAGNPDFDDDEPLFKDAA